MVESQFAMLARPVSAPVQNEPKSAAVPTPHPEPCVATEPSLPSTLGNLALRL
jgi:hypothetical protein